MSRQLIKRFFFKKFIRFEKIKTRFSHRLTGLGIVLLSCLVICSAMGIDTRSSMVHMAATTLFALFLIAIVYSFRFKCQLEIHRELPSVVHAGESLSYPLHITQRGRHQELELQCIEKPPLKFPDLNTFLNTVEPGERKRNWFDRTVGYYRWNWLLKKINFCPFPLLSIPPLKANKKLTLTCTCRPERRGLLHLSSIIVLRPDPFKIINAARKIHLPATVLVLPRLFDIPEFTMEGMKKGQHLNDSQALSTGESEEFTSLREFRPGDQIKHIHWKSTARTGKLTLREYRDDSQQRFALILDSSPETINESIFEDSISLAASFVHKIPDYETVLDLMFIADKTYCLSSGRNHGEPLKALEALAGLEASPGDHFKRLGAQVRDSCARVGGVIAIFQCWNEERKQLVKDLLSEQIPVIAFVITDQNQQALDPGPLKHGPNRFIHLQSGMCQEGLNEL